MPLKISKRNYFYLIAGFSLTVILAAIVLALSTITQNYKSLSYLDKAYGINDKIDKIYAIVKEADNHEKVYLITNKDFFKENNSIKKELNKNYNTLHNLLNNEVEQQENLIVLKVIINLKLKLLTDNKNYFKTKKIKYDSLNKITAKNDFIMIYLQQTIYNMKKTEYKRFSLLREKTFTKSKLSIFIIALTSSISILLLVSILLSLKREHNSKALVEKKLIASEKLLQQQVLMLNVSNKELEQFAYVASHDLEEPLRKISSFSEKINLKLKNYPDEEVIESLNRLNASTVRMRVLISDLLNYSRITRLLDISETVNLNSIFKVILDDFELIITAKNAQFSIANLNTIIGNNTQIRQLFQNLISNSLKFNNKPNPQITISAKFYSDDDLKQVAWLQDYNLKHKNYYCIFVKDNGIGFELQYLKQIFVIFQRLHGRSEYDGTGIGLAICKRIAENHQGFITAQSTVGEGTTFIVGLPSNNNI